MPKEIGGVSFARLPPSRSQKLCFSAYWMEHMKRKGRRRAGSGRACDCFPGTPMDASPLAYATTITADGKASLGIVDLSRGVFHKLTAPPNPLGALGFTKAGAFYSNR
jgi:hypothetical protein